MYCVGSPAEVVTNLHALVDDEVDDARVAHERLGDVHAERLVGEVAHLADLVADLVELARRRLDDARARRRSDTAEASCARAIQPIGACTIGMSTPSSSVTRVRMTCRLRGPNLRGIENRVVEVMAVVQRHDDVAVLRHRTTVMLVFSIVATIVRSAPRISAM